MNHELSFYRFQSRFTLTPLQLFSCVILLLILAGCGGGGGGNSAFSLAPTNVGGGYTLKVSGGTFNDGSLTNGLVILATLRDSNGNGPAVPWTLSVTGPGFGVPLRVSYDDGSQSSYMTWWWSGIGPHSGTYTATATHGSTTLVYHFSLKAWSSLSQPVLSHDTVSRTISWNTVDQAGSYYYRVTDGNGNDAMTPGYIDAYPLQATYSFQYPVLTDGSYLIQVYAQTTDRKALQNNKDASPSLASQENMSLGSIDLPVGAGYSLNARGGVLYEGKDPYNADADTYGLVIWTSILTAPTDTTVSPTPPAGDWNISVTGPGITTPITFTYSATDSQYVYWDFGTIPAGTAYTLTATPAGGGTPISQPFTIPSSTSQLPLATGLSVTTVNGGGKNISWNAASGAASYYVNLWTCVGAGSVNTASGCTNGGTYTEVAGVWVATTSALIPKNELISGLVYDVYVTACEQDMTDTTTVPSAAPGTQVNMSDTTFAYAFFTAQ